MRSHSNSARHGVLFAVALVLCCPRFAAAGVARIALDGVFDDWTTVPTVVVDASGDDGFSGVDFGQVQVGNDDRYLFFRFETGVEVQGDEQQSLRLYLDTDMDAGTGTPFSGIGADLVWDFGNRSGSFRGSSIRHDDIGLLLAPTVSSDAFEIALRLDARPTGGSALFPGNQVRFVFEDRAGAGDRVPDTASTTVDIVPASPDDPVTPLSRIDADHFRVASYNVLSDGIFDGGSRGAAFERILGAIDADVWVLNEVWDHGASETAGRLDTLVPLGGGATWNAVKRDSGNVIVSRDPIVDSWDILPGARLTAARIAVSSPEPRDVLVIAAHLSCCTADAQRQDQADALIAFLRDAQTPGGVIDLPADTPIVAAGDFNLVGWRRQFDTIVTGDIQDEGSFGPDHAPDWDGSTFDLPASLHTDRRIGTTWRNDSSSFYPGILDFVFVTGSVVDLGRDYILDTRSMPAGRLSATGLQAGDSGTASDHVPRVLDLVLTTSTDAPRVGGARLERIVPNPFNPIATIAFVLDRPGTAVVDVVDVSGRLVRSLVDGTRAAGRHVTAWDGRDDGGRFVASGVYLVRLRSADGLRTQKVTLVE